MCLYPRLMKNKKYIPTKKNGGQVPPVYDQRVLAVPIKCGQCMECRKAKKTEWTVRLSEDIKRNKNAKFITLTFNNKSYTKIGEERKNDLKGYELDNYIATKAVRMFTERWRKIYKKTLRHWLVTELGHNGTENIHLHGIIWTDEKVETVVEKWGYGYMWPRYNWNENYVNEKTINYIVKYTTKIDEKHKNYKSIILTSNGIGKGYENSYNAKNNKYNTNKETDERYQTREGLEMALPIYYRNKIYTEEEREKLWIEKLDKNVRWVNGKKIDTSNGLEEYYKALKYARIKNKELGYGSNMKDWKQEEYERQRRILLLEMRAKLPR